MTNEPVSVQLSVVIVNFRTPDYVCACLASLLPQLSDLPARVVVVDNHSGDASADAIASWLGENDPGQTVELIRSATNSGFAGGNNTGIRALRSDLYLLLNSDTLVRPGAISTLLESAQRFPDAGLISPRLEWPDGAGQESCFRFHTPFSELIRASQTGLVERMLSRYIIAMPVQQQVALPEWTSFACVLIRHEVFAQIGLLDEGYFMYFEDVEFCRRARTAGWVIVHNPEARVVHLRGGSSPVKEKTRQKKRLPRYFHESRTRFFYQSYGWFGLTAANLMWWIGRLVSKSRQVLGRSDKAAIERQWLDIWINWIHPLKSYTHPKT